MIDPLSERAAAIATIEKKKIERKSNQIKKKLVRHKQNSNSATSRSDFFSQKFSCLLGEQEIYRIYDIISAN